MYQINSKEIVLVLAVNRRVSTEIERDTWMKVRSRIGDEKGLLTLQSQVR